MTEDRPRLLFLCQNLPFPPDGGALIRSFHTLRLLSRQFEVTALCFPRAATRTSPGAVESAVAAALRLCCGRGLPHSAGRKPVYGSPGITRVASRRAAPTLDGPTIAAVPRRLQELAGTAGGSTWLTSIAWTSSPTLPACPTFPVVVAHHNVESQLLRRRAQTLGESAPRTSRRQADLTRDEERVWCPRVTLNVVVSDEDGAVLREIAPAGRYLVVPNGVDTAEFEPGPPGARGAESCSWEGPRGFRIATGWSTSRRTSSH